MSSTVRALGIILKVWTLYRRPQIFKRCFFNPQGSEEALTATAAAGEGKRDAKEAETWPHFLLQPQHFNHFRSDFILDCFAPENCG